MEVDTAELELEILAVLRAKLSRSAIASAGRLGGLVEGARWLRDDPGADLEAHVSNALQEAIRYHLGPEHQYLKEAMLLMAGLDSRTSPRTVGRDRTLQLEAFALGRNRAGTRQNVGTRRMQQMEKSIIAPAALQALKAAMATTRRSEHQWRDCDVDVRLYGDGLAGVLMRIDLTFRTPQSRLLIAVTDDGALADGLCCRHPDLTEVLVPSTGVPTETALAVAVVHGGVEHELQPVEPNTMELGSELRDSLLEAGIDEIYAIEVPTALLADQNEIRLTATQRLSVDEGFCYWTAPRESLVRSIRIDYSGFPLRSNYRFRVRPRLGFPIEVREREDFHQEELRVDAWIAAGCGFELLWQSRNDAA